jgi:hypothetical protein
MPNDEATALLFAETQRADTALHAALDALHGSVLAADYPGLAAYLAECVAVALRHTNRAVQLAADTMSPHPFAFDPVAGW